MNRITLKLIDGTWHAIHSGPFAAEIVKLFGTDTLPTPYTGISGFERIKWELMAIPGNAGVEFVNGDVN